MDDYWVVFTGYDKDTDLFVAVKVGVVSGDQLPGQLGRELHLAIPGQDEDMTVRFAAAFTDEPTQELLDALAPPSHQGAAE